MLPRILILIAIALTVAACAKKGADAIADAAVDVLLPSDSTPVDGAAEATASASDVTLATDVTATSRP